MAALIAGASPGSWYHLRWIFRFESQFQADVSTSDVLRRAASGGALLAAPGVMAAAVMIPIIASRRRAQSLTCWQADRYGQAALLTRLRGDSSFVGASD